MEDKVMYMYEDWTQNEKEYNYIFVYTMYIFKMAVSLVYHYATWTWYCRIYIKK